MLNDKESASTIMMSHLRTLLVVAAVSVTASSIGLGSAEAEPASSAAKPASTAKAASSSPFVGIPSNYVYNPRLGSLHDYCTKSPDHFPNPFGANADFRGPCARHDLCLGARTPSQTCNNRLWADLTINCLHWYGPFNPVRAACLETARTYWSAVTIATHL